MAMPMTIMIVTAFADDDGTDGGGHGDAAAADDDADDDDDVSSSDTQFNIGSSTLKRRAPRASDMPA